MREQETETRRLKTNQNILSLREKTIEDNWTELKETYETVRTTAFKPKYIVCRVPESLEKKKWADKTWKDNSQGLQGFHEQCEQKQPRSTTKST